MYEKRSRYLLLLYKLNIYDGVRQVSGLLRVSAEDPTHIHTSNERVGVSFSVGCVDMCGVPRPGVPRHMYI